MKNKKLFAMMLVVVMMFTYCIGNMIATAADPTEPTLTVESVNGVKAGDTVTIAVTMSNNPGICAAKLLVNYDSSLTLISAEDTKLLKGGLFNNDLSANPFDLTWEDGTSATGDNTSNGTIVKLTFKVADDAADGDYNVGISYTSGNIFNMDFDDVEFAIVNGTISVGVAPHEHSFKNYVSNNDATCEADGTKTAKCEFCDVTDTITDVGSKKPHSFTTYAPNDDATCEADGTKTATCDNCDATDTVADEGSKLPHSFRNYVSDNNATCTADGTKTALCEYGCGTKDTITDVGSKLGHSFTNYVYNNDATYLADGTETATCDRDGCTVTDTRMKTGSKLVDAVAPTGEIKIAENSWKSFVNTITFGLFCNDKYDVVITAADGETGIDTIEYYLSATPISEDDIVAVTGWTTYSTFSLVTEGEQIVYARITDKAGNVTYISTDGMIVDNTLPVIGGLVDGTTYCAEQTFTVDEANVDSITVNGVAATDVDGVYTLEATNEEYTIVVTDKAGNVTTVVVTVNDGHTFTNYVSNGDATCVEDGTKTATCDFCDATDTVADEGSKDTAPHKLGEFVIDEEATAHKVGKKHAECSLCGETVYEEIAKLAPEVVNSEVSTWETGSDKTLAFVSTAAFEDFLNVTVDGKAIDKDAYTVKADENGNTVVELKAEYLDTLSIGKHSLVINSESGAATAEFEVVKGAVTGEDNSNDADNAPNTGDGSMILLWSVVMVLSLCIFVAFLFVGKDTKTRKSR